jgi:hypothetical protein
VAIEDGPTSEELRRRIKAEELRRLVDAAALGALEAMQHSLAVKAMIRGELRCEECGESWRERRERWRAYVVDEGGSALVLLYCTGCAELEFGE